MAPHTRTRTGCWTCREAGYKCDELKPYCGRCLRLSITCKGYGTRLKWKNTTSDATPTRPRQGHRGGNRTGSASASPHSVTSDQRLLQYWTQNLCFLISVTPRSRSQWPFHMYVTAMASTPGALQSTILSMAANHLALVSNDNALQTEAYRHQQKAIINLQQLIRVPSNSALEPALATVLMMQISARVFGDDESEPQIANHLKGAQAMVARRAGVPECSASPTARFLLSLFAYHDILASVSRGSRSFMTHGQEFAAIEDVPTMQHIAQVLQIVERISDLQHMASTAGFHDDPALSRQFQSVGNGLQEALLNLNCSDSLLLESPELKEIRLTAEAYRHAAFIYLYRVWLNFGAPNPVTLEHVRKCISCILQIPINSSLVSSHTWPLWTAGCEAVSPEDRQSVRGRFSKMYESRKFPSLKKIVRDIEEVWNAKDIEEVVGGLDGMSKVDCIQVILKRRGREVDLA
ncbi:hypothetical protein K491DRAFT_99303 [Lophiostoma macrostomum CBS 122681]|uniref:Zn(2)-C6 fungal-type domain-containing protein n=1 Tax=Lophiostoma macrostomum CBS 122681 TaxID=1314788 RepID=A0A6A6SU69_9PLEO|nr:hypothetical protein K491DRAFT_99303 [Lophiostoma macrostomum CBS 122681]